MKYLYVICDSWWRYMYFNAIAQPLFILFIKNNLCYNDNLNVVHVVRWKHCTYQHFLLFAQCFLKPAFSGSLKLDGFYDIGLID